MFAGSGLSDDVGAVFEGQIVFPATGVWTLFTDSDDGSRLLVDGVQIVDNDGLHGMRERSGTIQVDQIGPRNVRVEFFERGGGAGVICALGRARDREIRGPQQRMVLHTLSKT